MNENHSKDKEKIVIYETAEMSNWLHPQTPERKEQLLKRAEQLKKKRLKNQKILKFYVLIIQGNTFAVVLDSQFGKVPTPTFSKLTYRDYMLWLTANHISKNKR